MTLVTGLMSQFGNKEISNNNLFYYSSSCSYIINNNLPNNNEFLNKVSALDISRVGNSYKLSFNKGRHSTLRIIIRTLFMI